MAANGSRRPRVDPRILRSWSSGEKEEELTEDSDETSLPWEDLGLGEVFGGRYIDADGTVVVCATDAILDVPPSGVRFQQVARSLRELKALQAELWRQAETGPMNSGVTGLGIDVVNNRLMLHALDEDAAARLRSQEPFATQVEAGALIIDITGPFVLL